MAADTTYGSGTGLQRRQDGTTALPTGGSFDIESGAAFKVAGTDKTAAIAGLPATTNYAVGVAAGYKIARGVHTQVAASDTVVTGLTTVVAVLVSPKTRTVKQLFFNADIGNQSGAPAAGSILITSQKPTAVNDVTPTAATDFTENIDVHWVAIGT